ncbi:hypothetical protein ACSF6V_20295 [Escherichia coli]|uniref:hypothetical protein n=1 Tax=Escherichia coli TaxID=562 RepID=UPI003EE9BEFC
MILLDNILRYCLDDIFKGFFDYDALNAYSMKITRATRKLFSAGSQLMEVDASTRIRLPHLLSLPPPPTSTSL